MKENVSQYLCRISVSIFYRCLSLLCDSYYWGYYWYRPDLFVKRYDFISGWQGEMR